MLQFRDVAAQFGEAFALRNFVSQVRPENRAIVAATVEAVFGTKTTALVI
jgi:hypothetical protein